MKIVINCRVGGFRLSDKAIIEYCKLKGWETKIHREGYTGNHCVAGNGGIIYSSDIERHDTDLIRIVENMGEEAAGPCTRFKIVDIPDGVEYIICEHDDGTEWIAEKHRTWD